MFMLSWLIRFCVVFGLVRVWMIGYLGISGLFLKYIWVISCVVIVGLLIDMWMCVGC